MLIFLGLYKYSHNSCFNIYCRFFHHSMPIPSTMNHGRPIPPIRPQQPGSSAASRAATPSITTMAIALFDVGRSMALLNAANRFVTQRSGATLGIGFFYIFLPQALRDPTNNAVHGFSTRHPSKIIIITICINIGRPTAVQYYPRPNLSTPIIERQA